MLFALIYLILRRLVGLAGDTGAGNSGRLVRDLRSGTTTRASVDTAGGDSNEESYDPELSGDGHYVVFYSEASDLIVGDGNGTTTDIFIRDLTTGTTARASVDLSGGDPNGYSSGPSVSSTGRYVAFWNHGRHDLGVPGPGSGPCLRNGMVPGLHRPHDRRCGRPWTAISGSGGALVSPQVRALGEAHGLGAAMSSR